MASDSSVQQAAVELCAQGRTLELYPAVPVKAEKGGGGGGGRGGRRTHVLPVHAVQPQSTNNQQLEVYGGDVTPLAAATRKNCGSKYEKKGFWNRCVGGEGVGVLMHGCVPVNNFGQPGSGARQKIPGAWLGCAREKIPGDCSGLPAAREELPGTFPYPKPRFPAPLL